MKTFVRKFIAILKIELEDTTEGLHALLDAYKKSEECNKITEYVSRENSGLVRHEIAAIRSLLLEIDTFSAEDFENVGAVETAVKEFIAGEIAKHGYPAALAFLVDRKVGKVRRYLQEIG